MKNLTRTAIITIAAASIGAASLAPALAQPFGGARDNGVQQIHGDSARSFRPGGEGPMSHFRRGPGFGQGGGLVEMFLSERGAEAIDIAAVRLTHLLELTDDQMALLEDLRLAALDAVEDVQAAHDEIAPVAEDEATEPDLVARFAGMVAMTTARAEALETLQPTFEAFVGSLDETQLEKLTPQRPGGPRVAPPAPATDAAPETPQAEG
ncbi:Spy/CpxP family protein refolding chaperone [Pelagibacterium halotolerans]|uniref:LTXXQ motif family protein n=1 Tax=Pelagibacterium halotolerans (strain DSM 22347 / JCM 15775 / CGMCC 1.7692 / B2) TaxID=1082931 RepID=G4RB89_PELHB|nr:hypothetical protein [Pelagibacterium halotolerans]AEQ51587.1 hypothetical protein KKY_1570 [Pelagibacterium halotolerans B2]QJR18583.1 hypothetical protein HKM20_09125 [Pelagibacterium halotolerans]SEA17593.1 hypothetical protein SAMN05428936_102207 [Pelagibacterium halotolerans]